MTAGQKCMMAAVGVLAAACSGEPPEGTPAHLLYGIEGAQALPIDALAALGGAAMAHWTRCADQLVTRDFGRDGESADRLVAAAPLALKIEAASAPPEDAGEPWSGVVRLSSARHRIAQADQTWSDWVGLTAMDMPVWTLQADRGEWRADFRPHADEADSGRYARQYAAVDCAALPDPAAATSD